MRLTLTLVLMFLSSAFLASMPVASVQASTWHSDIGVHGFYCPGGGKRVHLEDCPQRNGGGSGHKACKDDAKRFCGAVLQDSQARRACMRAHQAELSKECRAARAK